MSRSPRGRCSYIGLPLLAVLCGVAGACAFDGTGAGTGSAGSTDDSDTQASDSETTDGATTSEPTTAGSESMGTTDESTTMDPTTMDPTTMDPTTMDPTTMDPTTMNPSTDPTDPTGCDDEDNDGVCDGEDLCPGHDDMEDKDGDLQPDACDPCPADPGDDKDQDGLCGDVDNCPADANPDQTDSDNDGAGDPCDVCKGNYGDDLADYDGDGLLCKDDLCLFDGPEPTPLPKMVGEFQEITLANASVNGGPNYAVVGPGKQVSVAFNYEISSCDCPGCVTQGLVAIPGNPPGACFYSGVPGCFTIDGADTLDFTAPAAPGTYFYRFARTWEFSCVQDAKVENPATEFAAICVVE